MVAMLLAYDAAGNVIGTLDYVVARDDDGRVVGLIDFEGHESAGGKLRDIWEVKGAAGSGTWPEWIGGGAHAFRVDLAPDKRIAALVHIASGHRRERAALEAAIAAVTPLEDGAKDIRHLVGGPGAPLALDDQGRTVARASQRTPDHLPRLGD